MRSDLPGTSGEDPGNKKPPVYSDGFNYFDFNTCLYQPIPS